MAHFLEKVSYRIGVCQVSAQEQHRSNQQGNAARRNEAINSKPSHNVILIPQRREKNLGSILD
jgi:hypothetical protein